MMLMVARVTTVLTMLCACGPQAADTGPAETGEAIVTGSTGASQTGHDVAGSSSGSTGSATGSTGIGTTDEEVDECLPSGPQLGNWSPGGVDVGGDDCLITEINALGTMAFEMHVMCEHPDTGAEIPRYLKVDIPRPEFPFTVGETITMDRLHENCGSKNDQTFVALRDATGTLQVGLFSGGCPASMAEEPPLAPFSLQMVWDVCPRDGGWETFAIDVTVGGNTTRVFGGGVGYIDAPDPFTIYVPSAGVSAWQAAVGAGGYATVTIVRLL